ncbi:MAG TPA: peptide ABC transporter ATP-binding protein, partial [Aeromonas salmonicida]|nr:peptide ABC transporter ATP-binding protein [Aeromonas salmonicida]
FSHQQALLRQICHRVLRFGEAPAEQESMVCNVA